MDNSLRAVSFFLSLSIFAALTVGCEPIEQNARDAAAAAQGFIAQAQVHHGVECKANPTKDVCRNINHAVDAQNVLIDAIEVYCNFPVRPTPEELKNFTATCAHNAGARERLSLAIRNVNVVMRDVREAVQ